MSCIVAARVHHEPDSEGTAVRAGRKRMRGPTPGAAGLLAAAHAEHPLTCPSCACVSFLAVRACTICFFSSVDTRSSAGTGGGGVGASSGVGVSEACGLCRLHLAAARAAGRPGPVCRRAAGRSAVAPASRWKSSVSASSLCAALPLDVVAPPGLFWPAVTAGGQQQGAGVGPAHTWRVGVPTSRMAAQHARSSSSRTLFERLHTLAGAARSVHGALIFQLRVAGLLLPAGAGQGGGASVARQKQRMQSSRALLSAAAAAATRPPAASPDHHRVPVLAVEVHGCGGWLRAELRRVRPNACTRDAASLHEAL